MEQELKTPLQFEKESSSSYPKDSYRINKMSKYN